MCYNEYIEGKEVEIMTQLNLTVLLNKERLEDLYWDIHRLNYFPVISTKEEKRLQAEISYFFNYTIEEIDMYNSRFVKTILQDIKDLLK